MNTKIFILFLGILVMTACAGRDGRQAQEQSLLGSELVDPVEREFFNNLADLCGMSFRGEQQFMAEGRESWADKNFVMYVTVCDDDRLHIPFHLDDDQSRTWMFLVEDGRLRFRHDHRHADGTPEDETLYGGYGDGQGTAYKQNFPADEYTRELLPNADYAIWRMEILDEGNTIRYSLTNDGILLFAGTFDLSNPL